MPSFVAVNSITCSPEYVERFEELFKSRAHAIDRLPGLVNKHILKPCEEGDYLIVSYWDDEKSFKAWVGSPEFLDGHKRGFADIADAKRAGEEPPMKSTFRTYSILSD